MRLFPAGGDVCRPGHSDPGPAVLRVLRQFRHHPLVPAVDVLHLLRQVGSPVPQHVLTSASVWLVMKRSQDSLSFNSD